MHFTDIQAPTSARHVLGLSGGKDSAALAIYIKDKYPELSAKMEYFFTDTGAEMKEVYELMNAIHFAIMADRYERLAVEMVKLHPLQEL